MDELSAEEVEAVAGEEKKDPAFDRFNKFIALNSDQIIRYKRYGMCSFRFAICFSKIAIATALQLQLFPCEPGSFYFLVFLFLILFFIFLQVLLCWRPPSPRLLPKKSPRAICAALPGDSRCKSLLTCSRLSMLMLLVSLFVFFSFHIKFSKAHSFLMIYKNSIARKFLILDNNKFSFGKARQYSLQRRINYLE